MREGSLDGGMTRGAKQKRKERKGERREEGRKEMPQTRGHVDFFLLSFSFRFFFFLVSLFGLSTGSSVRQFFHSALQFLTPRLLLEMDKSGPLPTWAATTRLLMPPPFLHCNERRIDIYRFQMMT